MSSRSESSGADPFGLVTPASLRDWPLPDPGDSKYGRGQVVVLGGTPRAPGAVLLSGTAALRAGAGRLGLAVATSIATGIAVALPESAVVRLAESGGTIDGTRLSDAADDLGGADAVLVGPGLDDPDHAVAMLRDVPGLVSDTATVVLDAFALGVAPRVTAELASLHGRLILTPNKTEAALLLDIEEDELDLERDIPRIAEKYGAAVTCYGIVVGEDGALWRIAEGGAGLGTSGSGDVLAGAILGFAGRGATPGQAAVYGTWAHAVSGDRLADSVGALGFLARELADELPRALATL